MRALELPCERCGDERPDPRFVYATRSGMVRCGACWTRFEAHAALGAYMLEALKVGRKYNVHDSEILNGLRRTIVLLKLG
jgi:hypothetical protein